MLNQPNSPYLFIGGRSTAFALDKLTGEIVWKKQLKTGFFRAGSDYVTLSEGLDFLYAFTHGIAFCIDKYTGYIIWQKAVKPLKHEVATMTVDATMLGGGVFAGSSNDVSGTMSSGGEDTPEADGGD